MKQTSRVFGFYEKSWLKKTIDYERFLPGTQNTRGDSEFLSCYENSHLSISSSMRKDGSESSSKAFSFLSSKVLSCFYPR